MFGDLGAGLGAGLGSLAVLFGAAGEGGDEERARIVDLINRIQQPEFDLRELSPPELQMVAEYFPQYYEAHAPPEWRAAEDSPELRQLLGENVEYYKDVRERGLPLAEELAAREASGKIQRAHQGILQSSLEEMRRRGRSGGGLEAAFRLGGTQQATDLSAAAARDLQQQGILNRLRGAEGVERAGGALRGQDVSLSTTQANQMNQLNALLSQLYTNQEQENTARAQQAQWQNAIEAQRMADYNNMAQYQTALDNLNRQNALSQQAYQNQLSQAGMLTGAIGEQARAADAEQAARRDTIMGLGTGLGQAAGGAYGLYAGMPGREYAYAGPQRANPYGTYGPTRQLSQPTIFGDAEPEEWWKWRD